MLTAGRHIDVLDPLLPCLLKAPLKALTKCYRELTARCRCLPDYLIIGGRKCGSTSLYKYLIQHPRVLPSLKKEIFYFNHYYEKGIWWYRRHFPTHLERWMVTQVTGGSALTGEATPSYLHSGIAAKRIQAMNPSMRLIVVLRDPVAAVHSAYQFGLRHGFYTAAGNPFRDLVRNELSLLAKSSSLSLKAYPDLLLPRYVFAEQLAPWLDRFPRQQIHLLFLESFVHSPQQHYDDLLRFLGLPPFPLKTFQAYNANSYQSMDADLHERLRHFYGPHNQRLSEVTGLALPPEWESSIHPRREAVSAGT